MDLATTKYTIGVAEFHMVNQKQEYNLKTLPLSRYKTIPDHNNLLNSIMFSSTLTQTHFLHVLFKKIGKIVRD